MQARPSGQAGVALDTLRRGPRSRGADLTNRVTAGLNTRRALRRLRLPEGIGIFLKSPSPNHLALLMRTRYKAFLAFRENENQTSPPVHAGTPHCGLRGGLR